MNTALAIAKTIAAPFEGLRLRPYRCPAGVLTIGRGHAVRPGETFAAITMAEADGLFHQDMSRALLDALRHCPILVKEAGKLGAVADFVFNLGAGRLRASTLRRRINQRDWPEARRELRKWIYGGGRKLPGLVLRREAEAKYFRGT